MGELDAVDYKYLSDNSRYADLFNGVLFSGEQVLTPEKLKGEDTKLVVTSETLWRERKRDLIKKYENGVSYAVLGIENQENVSYIMPFRIMEYEAGEYSKQIEEIQKKHSACRDVKGDEFLSKFAKEDKLNPCVTLVLYWGERWDGPESLKEMLNLGGLPEQMKACVNDYPMHLVNVREFENTDVFQTDLKLVFDFMKCTKDENRLEELLKSDTAYRKVPRDAWKMMQKHGNLEKLSTYLTDNEEEEETVNMCQALDAIERRAIERGMERGRSEGLEALINTIKEFYSDFEELYKKVVANECYKDVTREQVRKYV